MKLSKEKASELGKKSSRKGIPNKSTTEIREAFQLLVSDKLPQLSTWLDDVARENPEKALDIIIKFSDFVIPKLQRTELRGDVSVTSLIEMTPHERSKRIADLKEKLKVS